MKIGEPEIMRRARLLQDSPELRNRLLRAYVETREVYEESPWLEEQIYRGFPGVRDSDPDARIPSGLLAGKGGDRGSIRG